MWKKRQTTTDFDRFRVNKLLAKKNQLLGRERKIQNKKPFVHDDTRKTHGVHHQVHNRK